MSESTFPETIAFVLYNIAIFDDRQMLAKRAWIRETNPKHQWVILLTSAGDTSPPISTR